MKRLGVLAFIGIVLVGLTGGFLYPKIADAQVLGEGSSYDYYYNKGIALLDGVINSLNQVKDTQKTLQNNPRQAETLAQMEEKIALASAMRVGYVQSFSSNKQSGTTPVKTQIAAIEAAMRQFNTITSSASYLSSGTLREPLTNSVMKVFLANFNDPFIGLYAEAKKIDNGSIQQGSIEATTLGNATPVVTAGQSASTIAKTADTSKCSLLPTTNIRGCLDEGFAWLIKNTLLQIAGFLLWVTANMFSYAIQIGVLNFSTWAPDSLYPIWLIVRQIVSLIIVFIGLYLGFMYILGRDEKFQKYIPWVIMFALFVNFSYPLTRTIIDISNVVSLNIYASTVGGNALQAGLSSNDSAGAIIMNRLGLQGLVGSATGAENSTSVSMLNSLNSTPAALLAVCFVLYAAYIFLLVTGIFLMRTFVLVLLTVASPILLVDSVLPFLGERAKMLRKVFFEQLIVAPIFMVMLALTLKFLQIFSSTGPLSATGAVGGLAGSGGDITIKTFFNLIMMLVMLHVMIKVTKSTAGDVGNFASNAMGKVGGFGLGLAAGGTGLLARQGFGAIATKARDSKWVQNNQDSFLGRRAYNLSNSVANSTFDIRNTAVAGKMTGLGMGMGMGAKMGYEGEAKKKTEEIAARAARIKTKYERDVIKDGKVIARKGDIDKEGIEVKERFQQNQGGAVFLTKKQQEELASSFLDESSSKDMEDYKKLNTKEERETFKTSLNEQMGDLKKNGDTTSPKAQALMRSIYDIEKQEKDTKKAFDLQLEKEIDKYKATSDAKKSDYLARLDKDMREAVVKATTFETTTVTTPEIITQPEGSKKESALASASNLRGQVEAVLANKPQGDSVPVGGLKIATDTTQSFNVQEQVTTMNFAQQAAAKREAAQKAAAQSAQSEMAQSANAVTKPDPATPIPSATTSAPATPAANQPSFSATGNTPTKETA